MIRPRFRKPGSEGSVGAGDAEIEQIEQRSQFRIRRVHADGRSDAATTVAGLDAGRASGYPRIAVSGGELQIDEIGRRCGLDLGQGLEALHQRLEIVLARECQELAVVDCAVVQLVEGADPDDPRQSRRPEPTVAAWAPRSAGRAADPDPEPAHTTGVLG